MARAGRNNDPEATAEYDFSLSVSGTGKVFINEILVVDNETTQRPGDSFIESGTKQEYGRMYMQAEKSYNILVKYGTSPTMKFRVTGATNLGAGGLRLGAQSINRKDEFDAAVELAKMFTLGIDFTRRRRTWLSVRTRPKLYQV